MTTSEQHSPFLQHAALQSDDSWTDSDHEPMKEDVSDGLQIFRKAHSWFLPSYTRKDCRCGLCSIGDQEPCPYARTHVNSMGSVLTAGRRSLSRLLSLKDVPAKDT